MTRTRYAYQVTTWAVYMLQMKAYSTYNSTEKRATGLSNMEWWTIIGTSKIQVLANSVAVGVYNDAMCSIPSGGKSFAKYVNASIDTIEDMGNPFLEDSKDLLTLDNKDIMPDIVVRSVTNVFRIGQEQYYNYVRDILKDHSKVNQWHHS